MSKKRSGLRMSMSPTVLSLWKTPLRGILKHRQADQHIRQKIRGGFFRKGSWIMRLEKVQDALNKKISNLNTQRRTAAEVWISCSVD